MAGLSILIVGRGPVAVLAARLAAVRGYSATLLLDPAPTEPTLFLGGREGVARLLEEESSCGLGVEEASTDPTLPLLLSLGAPHRLLGCRPTTSLSEEEENRFFPGLSLVQSALSPELDRRILLSVRKTSVKASFGQRIIDWFLEPEREKESLPRALKKTVHQAILSWTDLLEDLSPFSGLGARKVSDPENLRVLAHLLESRGRVLSRTTPFTDATLALPEVEVHQAETDSFVLDRPKKGKGFVIRGKEDRVFDRVLSLTAAPQHSLREASCSFDPKAISPLWPSCVLFKRAPGEISVLIRQTDQEEKNPRLRIVARTDEKKDPMEEMRSWVDRWNGESLFPFLKGDDLTLRTPRPIVSFPPDWAPSVKELTPLLAMSSSHYAEMVDPTTLPVVPDDFWADLSLAIPSLHSTSRVRIP